jgi:taurine dioxygenase
LNEKKKWASNLQKVWRPEHPIVITVDGKKTLYVSPGHLMKIKNVKGDEAEYLKNYLVDHVNKEEFIFSYEWTKGDICLWDNLSILHMASEIKNCRRVMHRITIK